MSLSVALMCHPSRERFVAELAAQLPEAEIVWDRENDRWETGRRSLLAFDHAADYHLVVQDDAVVCRDFVAGATKAAQATGGNRPIALYTGKVRPHQQTVTPTVKRALRVGAPWLEMPGPWWGVGVIVPTAHIPDLVGWGDRHPQVQNYDRRIAGWYRHEVGVDCWYTVPSLVDHRPVGENPSLIQGRTGNRQAHAFIGDWSPLDIDWRRPPIRLDGSVAFRHATTRRRRTVIAGSAAYRSLSRNSKWIEEAVDADVPMPV